MTDNTETTINPLNDLESVLLAAQAGTAGIGSFMDALLTSQVFVLVDRDPEELIESDEEPTPLVVRNHEGQPLLAIFTAAERAIAMTMQFSEYTFCAEVKFAGLIRQVAPGFGLVINPGTLIGLEMAAEGVSQLKTDLSDLAGEAPQTLQ